MKNKNKTYEKKNKEQIKAIFDFMLKKNQKKKVKQNQGEK